MFHPLPTRADIQFRFVEIGNFRWVEPVECLTEREYGLERIALVKLGLQDRDAGSDQAVLDMREAPGTDRRVGARQQDRVGLFLLRNFLALHHDEDRSARFIGVKL